MLRPLLIACAFLTRLPVRAKAIRPEEFGGACACFPLIGFGIGAAGLGLYRGCSLPLGAALTACVLVAFSALVSGGLHLDGLADWFDALGGGRGDRQRMLEIMHDPRIGAHGASALFIVLAAKLCALTELPRAAASMALLCAPACARWLAVCLMWAQPSARSEGLGHALREQVRGRHALIATSLWCGAALWFGPALLWPWLLASLSALLLGAWARARLGGLTGDVYGAAIEISELVFLVSCRVFAA